jgi:hypothetical protein
MYAWSSLVPLLSWVTSNSCPLLKLSLIILIRSSHVSLLARVSPLILIESSPCKAGLSYPFAALAIVRQPSNSRVNTRNPQNRCFPSIAGFLR